MNKGRYYITPGCDPHYNMGFDEWLFGGIQSGTIQEKAILRLYSWKSPAITIGYNQNIRKAVDFSLLKKVIPVVRRITGGRAIYHDPTEITFTFIFDVNLLPIENQTLKETNRVIAENIVEIFNKLGLNSDWAKSSDSNFIGSCNKRLKSCFSTVSKYEVTSGSLKIAAGAQRKLKNILIHQGSLKVNGISSCEAIGQREVKLKNAIRGYNIKDFSGVFGSEFSRKFVIEFRRNYLSQKENAEIQKFLLDFNKKILHKR